MLLVLPAGLSEPAAATIGLAHGLMAMAVSWKRGSRPIAASTREFSREFFTLLRVWLLGLAVGALVLAWPIRKVQQEGSLMSVLGLSAVIGITLSLLWRIWSFWQTIERERVTERVAWRRLSRQDAGVWRGLGVAVLLAVSIAGSLLLLWPDAVPADARWPATLVLLVLLPLLHWGIQRVSPAVESAHVLQFLATTEDRGRADQVVHDEEVEMAAATDAGDVPKSAVAQADLSPQLYEAARNGRVDIALELIEHGADVFAPPPAGSRDQRSLIVLASVLPDIRLLRALIERGVELNDRSARMTPLLAATRDSWHGRAEAVMMLLTNGADPRIRDLDGNTPLHHAARSTDPGVAALLLDAAAEIDVLNNERATPLVVAAAAGNWRLVKFLVERGGAIEPAGGVAALAAAAAAEDDDPAGVRLLLKHHAKIDAVDRAGRTALHEAVQSGHRDIVQELLRAGASLNARDAIGDTPWLIAARKGSLDVIEVLLPFEPDIEAVDGRGRNALMQACLGEAASPELVKRLFELGVDPNQPDRSGIRAVDLAAEAGRWAIVGLLDPQYPLPAVVTDVEVGVMGADAPAVLLREGLQSGRFEGLAALARLCPPEELDRLLIDPVFSLRPTVVEWLLENGADAEIRDEYGNTLLFQLLARGVAAVPVLQVLLRHAVSPAGAGGLAKFLAACVHYGQDTQAIEPLALELLDAGADPFAPSPAGDPALSLAIRLAWGRVQERLLIMGANPEARDSLSMTALHLATALGRDAALRLLILHGAAVNARTSDGQTPLGIALALGRRDLVEWLDWQQWSLPKRPLRPSDVPNAARSGDVEAVRRLLGLGFSVDAVDSQGCTALLRASGGGHLEIVTLLLARGANPQHSANSGATPLSAAVSKHHLDIVAALLTAGADVEQRLPGGVTALMLAAALGMPDVVSQLITANADVHAGDEQNLKPLHCAALYGFTSRDRPRLLALLDTLLLAGAEADYASASGVTPLLLLLGSGAELDSQCDEAVVLAGLERLLEEGVSLQRQDSRGFGPLHLAALFGLSDVVRHLLRAGADPDLQDSLGRTPREIALMRGFIDVAGEFASPIEGVSMARFLRDPH